MSEVSKPRPRTIGDVWWIIIHPRQYQRLVRAHINQPQEINQ